MIEAVSGCVDQMKARSGETATVTAMDLATECSLVLGAKAELLQKLQAQ